VIGVIGLMDEDAEAERLRVLYDLTGDASTVRVGRWRDDGANVRAVRVTRESARRLRPEDGILERGHSTPLSIEAQRNLQRSAPRRGVRTIRPDALVFVNRRRIHDKVRSASRRMQNSCGSR